MKKITLIGIFMIALFIAVSSAQADYPYYGNGVMDEDLSGSRTYSSYWPGFTISWNIYRDTATLLWTYEYSLFAIKKAVSHFILEVTDPSLSSHFINPRIKIGTGEWAATTFEGPMLWSQNKQGASNPHMPADIYGIKFYGGGTSVSYSFQTMQDPVWGNFYAKSGKDKGQWIYAYNSGLTNLNSSSKFDFIVRPDGGGIPAIVPEPVSSILFSSGGAVLVFWRYCKRKIRPKNLR